MESHQTTHTKKQAKVRHYLRIFFALIIILQAAYLSYTLWFFIITTRPFPPTVKLSAVIGGVSIGILWLLKEKSSAKIQQEIQKASKLSEEEQANAATKEDNDPQVF